LKSAYINFVLGYQRSARLDSNWN